MAQLALTLAGGVLGGAVAGGLGQSLGALFGAYLGGILDRKLLGPQEDRRPVEGARIAEFNLSGSAYGQTIPMIFGRMRVPANIIWVRGIREVVRTETETVDSGAGGKGGGGGGGSQTVTRSTYHYYAVSLSRSARERSPDALRRSVLDALAVRAEATAITATAPSTPIAGESPIVRRAKERAAATVRA